MSAGLRGEDRTDRIALLVPMPTHFPDRPCRLEHCGGPQVRGMGEGHAALPRRARANPLPGAEIAADHDPILEPPAARSCGLEVEIGEIRARTQDRQALKDVRIVDASG